MTNVLNPELVKESLVNGNTFLTSFYKLSRYHEKILLGVPVDENIHSIETIRISPLGEEGGSLGRSFSRSASGFRSGTAPSPLRRGNSRAGDKLPVLGTKSNTRPKEIDISADNKGKNSSKASKATNPDILSTFKYSGIFTGNREEYIENRAPSVELEDFPFSLNSPRRGVIELRQDQLPSPFPSRPASSQGGGGGGGMLARMFSGVNPWTASEDDLSFIGATSPVRKGGKSGASSPSSSIRKQRKSAH